MTTTFAEVIAEFRKLENSRILNIINRDVDLQQIVSAWGDDVLQPREAPEPLADGATIEDKWEWIWKHVAVDFETLQASSGTLNVVPKFKQALRLRMIYPDGTVHNWAETQLLEIAKRGQN